MIYLPPPPLHPFFHHVGHPRHVRTVRQLPRVVVKPTDLALRTVAQPVVPTVQAAAAPPPRTLDRTSPAKLPPRTLTRVCGTPTTEPCPVSP